MPLDIIAEVGSVHDGSFGNACKLIELAKEVGATTVKFQMHLAKFETTHNAPSPTYFKGEPRFEYFERTGFSLPQWKELVSCAQSVGIEFCCSPFSIEALEAMSSIGITKIKIPSGEVTNTPLLRAASECPEVILSSGMSSWAELDRAVETIRRGTAKLAVLQCTSEYPCPPENVGLNIVREIAARYSCESGFSDHTMGVAAPIGAVFMGARIIEKHLTFSRKMYGSDAKNAVEPHEFKAMVAALHEAHSMINNPVDKDKIESLQGMKDTFEKSLVAAKDIEAGSILDTASIAYKKPGTGMKPHDADKLVGRKTRTFIPADHLFSPDDVE